MVDQGVCCIKLRTEMIDRTPNVFEGDTMAFAQNAQDMRFQEVIEAEEGSFGVRAFDDGRGCVFAAVGGVGASVDPGAEGNGGQMKIAGYFCDRVGGNIVETDGPV